MDRSLYTHALIRSFYDRGDDYVDSFWPLVLAVLPRNGSFLPSEEVQRKINSAYGLHIPQHSLSVISTRAKRKGFMVQQEWKFALTPQGVTYVDSLEPERDVERRINELIDDAFGFLNDKRQLAISKDEVSTLLRAFIAEHLELFEQYINPEAPAAEVRTISIQPIHEAALLEYFAEIERARPTLFETLRDIIRGSIISVVIHSPSPADTSQRFERTRLYLDTNFLFSAMGLHHDVFNRAATELLELVKAEGNFELRVFDFTVDELMSVLQTYPAYQHMYVPRIKVAAIHSSLKSKGWTPSRARQFMSRIEEELWKLGIRIEPTDVNLRKYRPNPDSSSALGKYKPEQGIRGQNHDLAAMERISQIRGSPVRRLEVSGALFLTSDVRLTNFNIVEDAHSKKGTVAEVILDRVLTNVLWLKHPRLLKEFPLGSIISMHSRHLFIDRDVWSRFYEIIGQLRQSGSIDDRDIAILLYDQQIQEVLKGFRRTEVIDIKPDWVLQNIDSARLRVKKEEESRLEETRLDFDTKLQEVEKRKTEEFLNLVSRVKDEIKSDARRKSRSAAKIMVGSAVVLIGMVAVLVAPSVVSEWTWLEPRAWLFGLVVVIALWLFGVKADRIHAKGRLEERLFDGFYRNGLRRSKLEELEAKATVTIGGATS